MAEQSAAERYAEQARNAAAPKGLRQTAVAAAGYNAQLPGFEDSAAGRIVNESEMRAGVPSTLMGGQDYVNAPTAWYTGANAQGEGNGWQTKFAESFLSGQEQASKEGTLQTYFQDGGTGVVLWDHETEDGRHRYTFGDVVTDGKVVSNVYEDFDEDTANLMMAPWLLTGGEQRRIFAEDDRMPALARTIQGKRVEANENAAQALGAEDFQADVRETTGEVLEGDSLLGIVGGGALGGGVTGGGFGAAIGSVLPGAGTAIGGAVGAVAGAVTGGTAAYLNRDELAEQAARAIEIQQIAAKQGTAMGASQFLQQWGQVATEYTKPLTNLEHGLIDAVGKSEGGDAQSDYYATDRLGDSTRSFWMKPLSLSATMADSLMQFISPLNRAVYTAQIGSVIAGETSTLALTGTMFDPREGRFDNIFTDESGNFDPTSAGAGILKIGIDVVQLGAMRGLATQTARQRAAIDRGERIVHAAGWKFTVDAGGKVLSKRATFGILAPSEMIQMTNAARVARVTALKERRAVSADDFYAAATTVATGASARMKAALVNGFAEGGEEGVQAILEPVALDGEISGAAIKDAFEMGFVTGAGMSLGATYRAPTQDERQESQAFWLETMRRDGVEPTMDEWKSIWGKATKAQRRMMAARSEADVKLTAQALDRLVEQHSATRVASGVDVAKAIDGKRMQIEKELSKASGKVDQYHVIGGVLDKGRVDLKGNAVGTKGRAEAVEASAITIHEMLTLRVQGLTEQRDMLTDRLADLKADPAADPELVTQTEAALARASLARAVGLALVEDVGRGVSIIYGDTTTEAQAKAVVNDLNVLIESWFDRTASIVAPEGFEQAGAALLAEAGAQFATQLQSREPKLDSGSYVALLPRISWDLTLGRGDNMLLVNDDILAAINGDYDGDKMRSENGLILDEERFVQARAGQFLGGRGKEVDVGTLNYEKELVKALSYGLSQGIGTPLQVSAEETMSMIEGAITDRYGAMMSPNALQRVKDDFRSAVEGGKENAKNTLLDALAREASGPITDLGRRELNNEWLWIAKVVGANFATFQTGYRQARAAQAPGPSATLPPDDIDTARGTNAIKNEAVVDAQTLALYAEGDTLFRKFQKVHYSVYNAAVLGMDFEESDLFELASLYEELSKGVTQAEIDRVEGEDAISSRVLVMLGRLVDSALADPALAGQFNPATAMSILANVRVKNVWFEGEDVLTDDQDISLVQLLLKRSLDADRAEHVRTFATDEKLQIKHAGLRAMTYQNDDDHPVNAERAFIEVFGSVQFRYSLGGPTGHLSPLTTPEQWLREYQSHDEDGRKDMERFYTNHAAYLDRKESTNIPYTFREASRREISAYRSMMDALMAVGRSELTFDAKTPMSEASRALGGRKANVSRRAMADFIAGHEAMQQAAFAARELENDQTGNRSVTADLIQQMINDDPVVGRQILDAIPDAAANALYEGVGDQLYVVPWIYEMFAIEDPKEALFFYWKHLTMAQWNATQLDIHEDDADKPARAYHTLNSRFQRLLYQLSKETGQLHMDLLVRKMDEFKDIDEFFLWLNRTPGYRGDQAPFLPFHDDVADFEADAAGAWMTTRASGDLRLAIGAMRRGAETMRESMQFRAERVATDKVIADGIQRALDGDPRATGEDQENLVKLNKAVLVAHEIPRGFAPNAMLALVRGATRGFDAHAHDKGVTIDYAAALGEFQALMDAFGFATDTERTLGTLTAHSIRDLSNNIGDLAKRKGTAMDANGRPIEWERLTVQGVLDLMKSSETAPLAYALLTPKAMDITPSGGLTERVMMEATLKDILDNKHYQRLFDLEGDGALNKAMHYLSLVESRARTEGGTFDVMRYVNSLVIARTSKLGRPATEDDLAKMTHMAYLELAKSLQMVGNIMATPGMADANTLELLRKWAVKTMNDERKGRQLPAFADVRTGALLQDAVDHLLQDLNGDYYIRSEEIAAAYPAGPERDQRIAALDIQHEMNTGRINAVLTDDVTAGIVNRFRITGDPVVDQRARIQIFEYATAMSSPTRMTSVSALWSKMAAAKLEGRMPGDDFDWAEMSRAVMGVVLANEMGRIASHVSIPSFEPGKKDANGVVGPEETSRFYKYFDPAYTFIANDLLSENPMTSAARWLHVLAEQPREMVDIKSLQRELQYGVLDSSRLGSYTPGVTSHIVESHQRMDSAAAGQAIPMAGDGPKNWAVIAYGTKRTAKAPPPDALTALTLTADLLEHPNAEVLITPTGAAEQTTMPIAMLDNRFFASVKVNGTDIPLNTFNMGFQYPGEEVDTGLRYIALDRLKQAVDIMSRKGTIPASQLTIEIEFIHPDSRPEKGHEHSVYYDGMSHSLIPDGSESAIASLWSDNGGLTSVYTQRPLDAGKLGLSALQPFTRINPASVANAENKWNTNRDFAAMINAKTRLLMDHDELIEESDYNAVRKMVGLHHIIAGTIDGVPVAMTAAEVITFQTTNGKSAPLAVGGRVIDNAHLVTLSTDVLRSMMGETGTKGVQRFFDDEFLVNPDQVPAYTSITTEMLQRFRGFAQSAGSLVDTNLASGALQRTLPVTPIVTEAERNARDERIQFLNTEHDRIRTARYNKLKTKNEARESYVAALQLASGAISSERNDYAFMAAGIPIGPRDTGEAEHTMRVLDAMGGIQARNDYQRGWELKAEGGQSYVNGQLTVTSLDEDRPPEHQLAKEDIVVIQLDTFLRPGVDPIPQLEEALRYVARSGATVALVSSLGRTELRSHGAQFLEKLGHEPLGATRHLYAPREFSYRSQNEKAYESTFLETDRIETAKNVVTFLAIDPIGTDENDAVQNPASRKLTERLRRNNILPTSMYPNYNVPLEDNRDNGLYAKVLASLRFNLDPKNTEQRAELLAMGGPDPRGTGKGANDPVSLADALDRFYSKISTGSTLEPKQGTGIRVGDIIPFVHFPSGKVILYRHGMKAPDPTELATMQARGGMNIALAESATDPLATANAGVIVEDKNRANFGRSIGIEVPLQVLGNKLQLEGNGMKYIVVPPSDLLRPFLNVKVFGNGTVVDLYSDVVSADKKEAFKGRVHGYRNALTFFQFDFTEDLTKFFFPGQDPKDAGNRALTYSLLQELAQQREYRIPSVDAANIAKMNLSLGDLLGQFAAANAGNIPSDWVQRLQVDTDVSTQIARAMITYLLTPHAELDNVLKSAGFSHRDAYKAGSPVTARRVPGLFADLLDGPLDGPLHLELIRRFDSQLERGANGSGMRLHTNWVVEIFTGSAPITYKLDTPDTVVAYQGSTPIGRMNFSLKSGEIGDLGVLVAHQRRGVATGMLNFARSQGITITHSEFRTPAGEAWAAAQKDGTLPGLQAMPQDPATEEADLVAALRRVGPAPAATGADSLQGYLQFGEVHSSGDNPVLDRQAFDPNGKGQVSAHNALASALSIGGVTAHRALKKSKKYAASFFQGGGVSKFGTGPTEDRTGDSMWRMLTAIPDEPDLAMVGWRREHPAETARKALAREENVGFYKAFDEDQRKDGNWSVQEREQYDEAMVTIISDLNLSSAHRGMVDSWVRMQLGKPYAVADDGARLGVVNGRDAVEEIKHIRENVKNRLLPLDGAAMPMMDINHLTTIYMANLFRSDGREWAPRVSPVVNSADAQTWDDWVNISFGSAFIMGKDYKTTGHEHKFDSMFLLAVDGMLHGYQGATDSTRYLPVSAEILVARQLMDPDTNRMLVSIAADENLLATDPTLFNSKKAQLEELIGGQRIYGAGRNGEFQDASARGHQRRRVDRWRTEVDIPAPVGMTIPDIRRSGQTFVHSSTETSALWRTLINLRAGNALFNVALVISAPVEAFYRRSIDSFADIATGEAVGGIVGRTQSKIADRIKDTSIGAIAAALGVLPTYTAEEQVQLGKLVDALSTLPEFKAMVYKELMFHYPSMPGIGKIEKWFERYAKGMSRLQDPSWGMLPKDLARIYVKTVMRRIAADPTGENVYSIERMLTELPRNPQWVAREDAETHRMAVAAIANIRSLKPNVISLATRGIVDPLAANPKFLPNTAGNMLKILTLFQNFWSNSVINMTGLQGAADFSAFWLDGRKKSKLMRRFQAGIGGKEFVAEDHEFYDMSEVVEGLDLADSFIRGGITHTALFQLGMLAGGLGLTGEDEEEKWRRRAAEQQGAPLVLDPRDMQNDYRNVDSIYLGWLPGNLESHFRMDPADPRTEGWAQMNWTLRYFLSPVLGFERFYETGDVMEIVHGFSDALGTHPVVGSQIWNETLETAAELHANANEAVEQGDVMGGGNHLVNMVGVFERALVENSMFNMMYVGSDRYDRDPYKLVAIDSEGNPKNDVRNNPYATNDALRQFVDPNTGEVREGYVPRDPHGAMLRSFTENRFTMALGATIFAFATGQGGPKESQYFRTNMAVKTRKVELMPMDQDVLEADLLASFVGQQQLKFGEGKTGEMQLGLTESEAAQIRKKVYEDAGIWWDADQIAKEAKMLVAQTQLPAMSLTDEAGREHLTTDGQRAVFEGLKAGTVALGDASLNGVFMTGPQRDKIRDDIAADLVQEGVNLGLNEEQATWRMRRIMFGTNAPAGAPKMIDLIYTDKIPWTDTLEYNQLNTTYVIGPNGYPQSTGFTRDGIMGALGLKPLMRPWQPEDTGLAVDKRMNTVDNVVGINTGMRALEARPESWEIPSIEDHIDKAAEDIIAALKDLDFTPSTPYAPADSGSAWKNYGGYKGYRRRSSGGGYGGYSSGGSAFFQRMYSLPRTTIPYGNNIPFINTSNPIVRRADIRRERVWSERGRLKQWQ